MTSSSPPFRAAGTAESFPVAPTLDELLAERDPRELKVPAPAWLEGERVLVLTVLERTAVVAPALDAPPEERRVVRRNLIQLETVEWQELGARAQRHLAAKDSRLKARAKTSFDHRDLLNEGEAEARRRRSDRRAQQSQAVKGS
jgi:hypothetical protein